ncbi:MAG: DUF6448 family protein [Paludibacter sp.]|nr:DUF6448 family protein [Paludibacter sp.]
MKTKEMNSGTLSSKSLPANLKSGMSIFRLITLVTLFMVFGSIPAFAHCDSYDGPTIKDAQKALESNNVNLVLKWITPEQEKEVVPLFNKTYSLKSGDKEVYSIVEKYFFETLVRLHRETEGAPFTGLKAAGTTKPIVQMSDEAIANNNIDDLLGKLNKHIGKAIKEKYDKVARLNKIKNDSPDKGREYVEAYVDYTHTIEAIHDIIDQTGGHSVHKH